MLQCHSIKSLAKRICKTHSLDSTAQGDLLTEQVDLLSKQINLRSSSHLCTDLQWTEMVKLDDNDSGGAMTAQTHCANLANTTKITMTRK